MSASRGLRRTSGGSGKLTIRTGGDVTDCPYEARGTGRIRTSSGRVFGRVIGATTTAIGVLGGPRGRPRASTRTGGDVPERPCRQLAATPGRLCSKLAATPERPCCHLTATLGLSLYDPASKEEPVRATRTGPQLVSHFAMLLFTLSLQGMRMEQARTRADVAGDRGLSPVRSEAFHIGVLLQVMRMGARPPADVAV